MRIAVVIPVYNRAEMVMAAVDSVWEGRRKPDVLVVVDDGSTDDTWDAVAARLERAEGRRILLRTKNRGVGAARKAGLEAAFAAIGVVDAVAFLDSDDVWPPCFLSRAEAAFEARPDATIAVADRMTSDARRPSTAVEDLSAFAAAPHVWIARHGAGISSCALVRASAATEALSLPDAEAPTGQDIPFLAALASRGACVRLDGPPVVVRRNHATKACEQRHLSQRFDDALVRWAGLVERACAATLRDARCEATRAALHAAVAGRWISAAKDCARRGRFAEGRECLSRARSHDGPAWRILRVELGLLVRQGWSKLGPARNA